MELRVTYGGDMGVLTNSSVFLTANYSPVNPARQAAEIGEDCLLTRTLNLLSFHFIKQANNSTRVCSSELRVTAP